MRGDTAAWDTLVARYACMVYAAPCALGCTPAVAESIMHDAFRSLAEHLPDLQRHDSLAAWLLEAARAACVQSGGAPGLAAQADSYAALAERLLGQQRLRQAASTLPPRCQALLEAMLATPGGGSLGELAQKLELSPARAEAQRADSLKRLLEAMAQAEPGAGAMVAERSACREPFARLVAYAEGELRGEALEQLASHLRGGCPVCSDRLARLEPMLGLLHTDHSRPAPDDSIKAARALFAVAQGEHARQWALLPGGAQPVSRGWAWVLGVLVVGALVVGLTAAYAYWPLRRAGQVAEVTQGSLRVKLGQGAPWVAARVGQVLVQGARLEAAADTVAVVRFWDGSLLRVEALGDNWPGEWTIQQLQGSRNQRVVRLAIVQTSGRASYASAPPNVATPAAVRVALPEAELVLVGTATATVMHTGALEVRVHEGRADVHLGSATIALVAGQVLDVQPNGTYVAR
jgi:DNA-directed RNA polymerase specialized sigma24 family protein